jgi:peptidyl-prolyl cis-trans isomerase B (cyclophilin B)
MAGEVTTLPNDGDQVAVFDTEKGEVVVRLFADVAPNHAANFRSLVAEGFYDGTRFHRCIAGFMVQGGDPNTKDLSLYHSWGTGAKKEENGKERRLKAEFNKTKHVRGILSAARSNNPDSASSQFFLMVANSPHLDGQYSAFGEVVSGMDVVDEIVKTGDPRDNGKVQKEDAVKINKAELKTWPL